METIILKSERTEGKSGRPAFHDIHEAFAFINEYGGDVELEIHKGVYWLHNPEAMDVVYPQNGEKEPYGIRVKCKSLRIVGLGGSPSDTVIAANRGQSHGACGNYTMFFAECDFLELSNLTIGNYCSVDLVYQGKKKWEKRTKVYTQAQLGTVRGKFFYAKNCDFVSRLNLNPFLGAEESLYEDCHFECTDDALNGNAVHKNCSFDFYGRRPIYECSGNGAVFQGCRFVSHVGTEEEKYIYFTKMPGKVCVEDSNFLCLEDLNIAWTPYPKPDTICTQKNVLKNGKPYEIIMPPRREIGANRNSPDIEDAPKLIDGMMETDFSNMPTKCCPQIANQRWTIDTYRPKDTFSWERWEENDGEPWKYGETGDGCVGVGYYQGTQGARLMFSYEDTKVRHMRLELQADPAKILGQGFGLAGQYMDILLCLDTLSMTGYGLRIIRLPKAADACFFALIKYRDGGMELLNTYEVSAVFRTGCTICMKTQEEDRRLYLKVDITTSAKMTERHRENGYQSEIHQKVEISDTGYRGFGILHTGTVGSGGWQNTTMLHRLKVCYE